jgi:shikimate kinase
MNSSVGSKVVYLMIGAKGSGKTYIGNLLERKLEIPFLRVEQRLIEHIQSVDGESDHLRNDGYDLELNWIDEILQTSSEAISEATGSSKHLPGFITCLKNNYNLKLIRISCPLDTCFKRVKARNQDHQFDVSDALIRSINAATDKVKLGWSLVIDNAGPALDTEILQEFSSIR